ncbi:MAG: type II toxin-antitoxin system RelE/ParE family toxin [Elusimicrobiota bacterium]
MPFTLEFYRAPDGEEPVLDYIRAQVKSHRVKIGRALQYLEDAGYAAKRPLAEHLGGGIYELRAAIERHQHRPLYFFHGRSLIVVANAFLKKGEKVPQSEADLARRRRADWLERCGGNP